MQQAITWANVDPDLCHHMASLGPKELILLIFFLFVSFPQGEENLIIPIHAYPVMSTDIFPSQLTFPPVPVGHK